MRLDVSKVIIATAAFGVLALVTTLALRSASARKSPAFLGLTALGAFFVPIAVTMLLHPGSVWAKDGEETPIRSMIALWLTTTIMLVELVLVHASIALWRFALRNAATAPGLGPIAILVILAIVPLTIALVAPSLAIGVILALATFVLGSGAVAAATLFAFLMNAALWAVPAIMAAFAIAMVIHKPVWPLASRLAYALQRNDIASNKKWLRGMAVALAVVAAGSEGAWQKVRDLLLSL